MGRRIISSLLAMALIFSLPVFSLADWGEAILKDSGSPEVSLMALRSIAADDGISLAAAEGNSGQFGYNIEPFDLSSFSWVEHPTVIQYQSDNYLTVGSYSITVESFNTPFFISLWDYSSSSTPFIFDSSSSVTSYSFDISSDGFYAVIVGYYKTDFPELSLISVPQIDFSSLTPVEGISSGYTYSSGIIPKTTRSIFETLTPSFGNQPAGKYLVNIYHWGDSYDVKFHISDSTESYYLPTSTNGGVTTLVYNHPGGAFTLDGSFTVSNIETSVIEGDVDFNGSSSYGDLVADGPLSWVFNISDIVAIPYEQASDSNFGFFAPIIGFFRDQFSDMKSWIAVQIDKIAGDDETQSYVDQAQDSLNKEVEELGQLSTDLTTQTDNLEQQFTTDFAIPSEVLGQTGAVQQIYNFLFSSLGIFSIFIWLPVVLAVIKKLLRL